MNNTFSRLSLSPGHGNEQRYTVPLTEVKVHTVEVELPVDIEFIELLEPVLTGPEYRAVHCRHLFLDGGNHLGHIGAVAYLNLQLP